LIATVQAVEDVDATRASLSAQFEAAAAAARLAPDSAPEWALQEPLTAAAAAAAALEEVAAAMENLPEETTPPVLHVSVLNYL
jgi:ABC-type transport system involved in cytochrome c biogenesis ATPase subunit